MTVNAITISSQLEATGMDKRTADAVASAIVDHKDESLATKADVAELKIAIAEIKVQMRMMMAVQIGTFIGIILLFLGN